MTHSVIYHDFGKSETPVLNNPTATELTKRLLRRGRRWHRFYDHLGQATHAACLVLCGVTIGVSLCMIAMLL